MELESEHLGTARTVRDSRIACVLQSFKLIRIFRNQKLDIHIQILRGLWCRRTTLQGLIYLT